jgi:hypothetical protein
VALDEDGQRVARDDLLQRRGRGWTLAGQPVGGFVQPWSEPWRAVGPAAAAAFGGVLDRWRGAVADDDPPARPRRWRPAPQHADQVVTLTGWDDLPAEWRLAARPRQGGDLRRRLTARGLGRGGDGVVLRLRRLEGALVARSNRWPGTLTLAAPGHEAATLPPEAFLPLWPLAEFLD